MDSRRRDTFTGACVVLAGLAVLAVAYGSSGRASVPGYELAARFQKADGISVGSDVRLSGVSVGKVVGQSLDDRFRAVLTLHIAPEVQIPDDSAALIQTDGLLGAKFIAVQVGGDENVLKPGQSFQYTQDSVNVQDLLEQIIAQGQNKRAKERQAAQAPSGVPQDGAAKQGAAP